MGKPPTDKQLAQIVDSLAAGESVRDACTAAGVDRRRLYADIARDDALAARIARAREIGQIALADGMLDIADDATAKTCDVARLRIWARQWHAAKVAPKRYGERMHQEITGAGGGPLTVSWVDAPPPAPPGAGDATL